MKHSNRIFLAWISTVAICICTIGIQPVSASEKSEEPVATQNYLPFSALPDNIKVQLETNDASSEQKQGDMVIPSNAPFTITVEHADGSRTIEVFADPIRYTDEEGTSQFIDTAMQKTDWKTSFFEGYAYKNASNDIAVQYSNAASKGLEVDDTFKLHPSPEKNHSHVSSKETIVNTTDSGNGRLVYPEAFGEHTYVEYINTIKGFKENIVLAQYTGQNRFNFRWSSDTHACSVR